MTRKILVLNCYKNHKISAAKFTKWCNSIIDLRPNDTYGCICVGDFNTSNFRIHGLTEIAHDGLHSVHLKPEGPV